eukprot:scaffold14526_cov67-Phaeocystis_antarctica.AAC.1
MPRRRARGCGARPTRRCRIPTGTQASPTIMADPKTAWSFTASEATGKATTACPMPPLPPPALPQPPSPPPSPKLLINFQPENTVATVPSGWLKDTGAIYADRGNGQSYGWSCDLSADTRERGVSSDPLLDTFVIFDRNNMCALTYWSIELAPGTYLVEVGCGDVLYAWSTSGCTVGPS